MTAFHVCILLASCVRDDPPSVAEPERATDSSPDSPAPDSGPTDTGTTDTGTPDSGDTEVDGDSDGFTKADGDCNDTDPSIHPGATDDCYDAVDQDCDGVPRDCDYDPLPDIMLDAADTTIRPSDPGGLESVGNVVVSLGDLDADGNGDFGTLWLGAGFSSHPMAFEKEAWVFSGPVDTGSLTADAEAVAIVSQSRRWERDLTAMASAGDVDGDGYDDIVLASCEGWSKVRVLLGPVVGNITLYDDAAASWSSGVLDQLAGWSVDGGFDFDGDAHDDFIVGAPLALHGAGAAYWISGADLDFETFFQSDAKLDGLSTDTGRGWAVTGLGDVDGDGLDDMATGARTGTVFVYTGGALDGELDSLEAAHAAFEREADLDQHGNALADGGDFNDDGYADLLMAATDSLAGTVHVMAGPMDASGDAAALALATFTGESAGDDLGDAMDGSMDVNLDGNTDLLLGAPLVFRRGSEHVNGAAYLFYGPMTGAVDMSMARCAMRGTVRDGSSGWSVAMIGDQYGDGAPEVLIGDMFSSDGATGGMWIGGRLSIVSSEHL